ncbi:MAG TPA: AAA family ATPase [Thermoanaerobaculia bacterium]|nr:AAA family ATPase [Thermoanaerobaculia bacterium]
MRLSVSGTHFSGKSTLVEELSSVLPGYLTVEEPYYLLMEEGHEFDFELQLERSIELLSGNEPDVIFDRCPVDMLGYLLVLAEDFHLKKWLPRVQAAIDTLDLIVFLPVEARDRIDLPSSQDAGFRLDVDQKLKEIFLEDALDLEMEVVEVTGSLDERVRQVLSHLAPK